MNHPITDPNAPASPYPSQQETGFTKREVMALHVLGHLMGSEMFQDHLEVAKATWIQEHPERAEELSTIKFEEGAAMKAVDAADALIRALNANEPQC